MKTNPSFQESFFVATGCPVEKFPDRVLARVLYPQAFWWRWVAFFHTPSTLAEMLDFLREAGETRSRAELVVVINGYLYAVKQKGRWGQKSLRMRISGRRLLRLHEAIYGGQFDRSDFSVSIYEATAVGPK